MALTPEELQREIDELREQVEVLGTALASAGNTLRGWLLVKDMRTIVDVAQTLVTACDAAEDAAYGKET